MSKISATNFDSEPNKKIAKFRHLDCLICCFINQSNQIASIHCCVFSLSVRLQLFSVNMDTIDVKNVLLALFIEHGGNLKTSKSQQLNAIVVRGRLCCGKTCAIFDTSSVLLWQFTINWRMFSGKLLKSLLSSLCLVQKTTLFFSFDRRC